MSAPVPVIARLTWLRLVRGRAIWITVLLCTIPILVALVAALQVPDAAERWSIVAELSFRSLVLLAPVVHLAGALGEETDGKTYTYLWSRPIPRRAVLLGKMLAMTPLLCVLAPAALVGGYLIVAAGAGSVEPAWLARALPAAALGVVTASTFALGLGALVPRHPLVAALAWVFIGEQILPAVPAVQNLSALHHVEVLAALPHPPSSITGQPAGSAIALLVLAGVWLTVALWRVQAFEPGSVDG